MTAPLSKFSISYSYKDSKVDSSYVVSIENPTSINDVLGIIEEGLRAVGFDYKFPTNEELEEKEERDAKMCLHDENLSVYLEEGDE